MNVPTHRPGPDRLDEASAAFRSMPVPDPPADDDLVARLAADAGPAAGPRIPRRRGALMRLATLAAAAAVLLAGGALFLAGPSAVALADVVRAAERHAVVRYRDVERFEPDDGSGPAGITEHIAYADLKESRFRRETLPIRTLNGAVEFRSYTVQDNGKGLILTVTRQEFVEGADAAPDLAALRRRFEGRLPLKEARLDAIPEAPGGGRARPFLDELRALQGHEGATSGREVLDGREAIKFVVEDGRWTTTLWVDARTNLPVRMRMVQTGDGELTVEYSGFEWDPDLAGVGGPRELFDIRPPEGFTLVDQTRGG